MRRAVPGILAFLGLALVMAGIAVFAAANHASVPDFGWTSYAPLEPQVPGPFDTSTYAYAPDWTVLWTAGHLAGAGLAVLGLLVLAGVCGWALGRRTRPPG
ncbi:MAG TPA: hypothetical protein VK402_03860 [Blastococcus sp.]|nr:hypothetical protein [Blastococcus sp.]